MLKRILTPAAFAPVLPLALGKIARTPRARVSIVYHLVPRTGRRRPPQENPAVYVRFLSRRTDHAQLQLMRKLGAQLLVDRLVAGPVLGEQAPLDDGLRWADEPEPRGRLIDLLA